MTKSDVVFCLKISELTELSFYEKCEQYDH